MAGFDPKAYLAEDDAPAPGAAFDPKAYLAEPEDASASEDPRTTGEKWQDIFFGNKPKPDTRPVPTPEQDAADRAEYMRRLPSTVASVGMMALPTPAAPLTAIGAMGLEGAGVGALEPAENATERLKNAAMGGVTAGALGTAAEGLGAGAKAVWPAAKRFGAKVGELVTGTPKQEILTYGEQAPAIKQMMAAANDSVPAAADNVREDWQKAIQNKKQSLNTQIATTLKSSPQNKTESIQPILDALDSHKARLDPVLHEDAISAIDDLSATVRKSAPSGTATADKMNAIKQFLQERSKRAYMKAGQMFQSAPQAAQAAKGAGGEARGILNVMEPKVADANNQLALLHDIDEDMNSNLIAPGKSDAAVMAAGAGANPRNAMLLKQLGDATGKDMVGDAQKLAAARTFASPKWDPREMTGKSLYRAGVGAALGGMAAHEGGEPWEAGAVAGGLLASPAALKLAIDAGRPVVGLAQRIGPKAAGVLRGAAPVAAGLAAGQNSGAPEQPAPTQQLANRAPAVGEGKWAQSGLQKLGIQDANLSARLLADPKARQLLIQASDLAPGSKAMQKIMDQIKGISK